MMRELELWLYGSRARGNADEHSDTDILAIAPLSADIAPALAALSFPRVNVSRYSWEEIDAMHAYGSLFLHHIATEGQRLKASAAFPHKFPSALATLPPFSRAKEDLRGFQRAFAEGVASLREGGWPDFECEVIASVARHAAILGAFCLGTPAFGRVRPFEVVVEALGYNVDDARALVAPATAWRLHLQHPDDHPELVEDWIIRVERFLNDLGPLIDDYESILRIAA